MTDNPYKAPISSSLEIKEYPSTKLGAGIIIFMILLIIINVMLGVIAATMQGMAGPYSIGYIAGRVFIAPIIVVALFQIGKRFRNSRSRIKIFMWTSVVVTLSLLGNIISSLQGKI